MSLRIHRIKNNRWTILLMIVTAYLSITMLRVINKTILLITRFNYWVLSKSQPLVPLLQGGIHGAKSKWANRTKGKG